MGEWARAPFFKVTPLTSQWRVCPTDSFVPTMSASAMTRVKLPVRDTLEFAGTTVRFGAEATSVDQSV